jgi:hypothetical protein
MLQTLDAAFFVFHAALILFNMVGWAFVRTRRWHLLTFGGTAFMWFVVGAFVAWGYCPCSDAHFRVRRALGYDDPETSYVQLLANRALHLGWTRETADGVALAVFVGIVIATAAAWWRVWRQGRAATGV